MHMKDRYILCVDDEPLITTSLRQELRAAFPAYKVESALSGAEALDLMKELLLEGAKPAVLVTDERMGKISGHELMIEARRLFPNLYSILLTGYTDIDALTKAINEGGLFRYIKKHGERRDLTLAVGKALSLYKAEREVCELKAQIEKLNYAVVAALENKAHKGDEYTYTHVQRVARYAEELAETIGLDTSEVNRIRLYAPLHDIGKSAIPSEILNKKASLSSEEFELVKTHVEEGAELLSKIELDPVAKDIILYHHERWDGSGYQKKLKGEDIPLSARIVAVADVADAMLSPRPYTGPLPYSEVADYICEKSGSQFDPQVVEAFCSKRERMQEIAEGN